MSSGSISSVDPSVADPTVVDPPVADPAGAIDSPGAGSSPRQAPSASSEVRSRRRAPGDRLGIEYLRSLSRGHQGYQQWRLLPRRRGRKLPSKAGTILVNPSATDLCISST